MRAVIVGLLLAASHVAAFAPGFPRLTPTRTWRRHLPSRADESEPLTVTHLLKVRVPTQPRLSEHLGPAFGFQQLPFSPHAQDLEFLGPCRFVVVGPGAILEAVGAFDSLRCNDAGLATVSNDDNSFECHIRLSEVRGAQFAKKETEARTMHIVRLLGEGGLPLCD